MINLINILNIPVSDIENEIFDLGIFASGYESRSSYLARKLSPSKIKRHLIIGFSEHSENIIRKENDSFYIENYSTPVVISSNDEKKLYNHLNDIFLLLDNKPLNVLIDYTSMSRLWYSGILNFIRYQTGIEVNVYVNYSYGEYSKKLHDYSYISINSLPSHEGSLSTNTRTLLVLGVGFYPELAQSIIEEIEPNDIIGILPIPSLRKEYEIKSLESQEYLKYEINRWLKCPVNDLESIYRTYSEITSNNVNDKDMIFISLGPKIFTLASILVGQKFEQITCLYLKSNQNELNDIKATGDCICNRIVYK